MGGGRTDAINLLYVLPEMATEHQFLAVVPEGCGYEKVALHDNCRLCFVPVRPINDLWRLYFDNVSLVKICKEFKSDLLFTMCNNGPLRIHCDHIVMLRRPQFAYGYDDLSEANVGVSFKLKFLRWYFQKSLTHAKALVVQTDTMKNRVKNEYAINCPVHVVGKAVSQTIRTSDELDKKSRQQAMMSNNKTKWKLLYLTKYYPHKNIEGACDAINLARKKGEDVCLFLTLNPKESNACKKLIDEIENNRYGNGVKNLGTVDLADIPSIYNHCDAVFIPTLLESYSATFLEAMAYKKPLLTSDRAFAREICGNAAIYFEPLSVTSMLDAIQKLTSDGSLVQDVVSNAKTQYKTLSTTWNEIAEAYLDVLLTRRQPSHDSFARIDHSEHV